MSDIKVQVKYEGSDEEYTVSIAEIKWDKVTYINASYKNLKDLKWIKKCPNLQTLAILSNNLTSLDGLQNCPALQDLQVHNNNLTSLNGLQNCTNLRYLDIWENNLTSLDGLQNCTALQELYIYNNNLSLLDGLQNCTALQTLDISYNTLTSLDGIQNCTALQVLGINWNKLTSLDGLQNCPNLLKLWAYNNKLNSLDGLQNCPNLQYLDISSNKLSSLDGLPNCPNLQKLYISYNNLSSLDGLPNCPNLQILDISYNNLSSLDGLPDCPNLQILDISYNKLSSLDGLQNCPNLQSLGISNNNLTSLDGLQTCTALQKLIISNNNLTSLDGLQYCIGLQYLNISRNPQITSLPNFLIEFRHLNTLIYDGLELELEARMRRWLNRLQNHSTSGIQVYGNSQNVHDSSIQDTVRASMRRLLNQANIPKQCLDTLRAAILKDCILTEKSKEQLLTYIESTEELHELCLTYSELLWVVWQTIDTFPEETQKEIKLVLNQELEDGNCKCFTGRMSRLVNCLSGFSPLVEVKILDSAQIGNIVILIKNRLEESEEGYSVEKHREEFRKEMLDRGESVRLIEEWVEYIE